MKHFLFFFPFLNPPEKPFSQISDKAKEKEEEVEQAKRDFVRKIKQKKITIAKEVLMAFNIT